MDTVCTVHSILYSTFFYSTVYGTTERCTYNVYTAYTHYTLYTVHKYARVVVVVDPNGSMRFVLRSVK